MLASQPAQHALQWFEQPLGEEITRTTVVECGFCLIELTKHGLARIGLRLQNIRDYEMDERTPLLVAAAKLARALGTDCSV